MSKITNEVRESIVLKALKHSFDARIAQHEASCVEFADATYKHAYGEHEAAARALGAKWLVFERDICVEYEEFGRYSCDDGQYAEERRSRIFTMSKDCPIPHGDASVAINTDHPLFAVAKAIADEHLAIVMGRRELRSKLMALLRSVTTFKRLREIWPEGAEFFPAEAPSYTTAVVPVSLTLEINKMLGIKTSIGAAKTAISKAMA